MSTLVAFHPNMTVSGSAQRLACGLLLSATLLGASGCESEQCNLNITLGGALEWAWVWIEEDACSINTAVLLNDGFESGTAIRFPHGEGTFFEFTVPTLAVGTHFADSVIYSEGGQVWEAGGFSTSSETICSVAIGTYELVDWVQRDRHRVVGTVVCDGPLDEVGGNSELTVSNVTFSVYAPEGY